MLSDFERWDILEIDQYKLTAMNKGLKLKVGKFQRKVESSSHDSMRYTLFSLRLEILKCVEKILLAVPSEVIRSYGVDAIELSEFFSKEMSEAVERGVTVTTLNGYLQVFCRNI